MKILIDHAPRIASVVLPLLLRISREEAELILACGAAFLWHMAPFAPAGSPRLFAGAGITENGEG